MNNSHYIPYNTFQRSPMSFHGVIVGILLLINSSSGSCNPINDSVHLKIALYDEAPMAYFDSTDNTYKGLMVELWEDIARDLAISYDYQSLTMEKLVEGIKDSIYQLGLGAITITPERELMIDFTHAINPSGTSLAISTAGNNKGFIQYAIPALVSVGLLVLLLFFIMFIFGFFVWLIEGKDGGDKQTTEGKNNFSQSFIFSALNILSIGFSDKMHGKLFSRFIGILWLFISIILISLFTVNASTLFESKKDMLKFPEKETLSSMKIGVSSKSSGEEYCTREKLPYQAYPLIEDAVNELVEGRIDVVIANVPVLTSLKNHQYRGKIALAPTSLIKNNMGIAMPENFYMKEDINRVLLKKMTETKWQQSVYKYLGE